MNSNKVILVGAGCQDGLITVSGLELLRKRTVQRAGAFGTGTHSRADSAKNRERQTG